MYVAMSPPEVELLSALLRTSSNYLEFGTGGSTILASKLVRCRITSVDSSPDWLEKVQSTFEAQGSAVELNLVLADVGPVGDWGFPSDPSTSARWPAYYEHVWGLPHTLDSDLCLIDGRFRVACFLSILLRGRPDTLIAFHDFRSRPHYHVVRTVAREIAIAENLSVFLPNPQISRQAIAEELERHRFNVE